MIKSHKRKAGDPSPAERNLTMKEVKITMELTRAAKYYLIMEEAIFNKGNFQEAHKNFVEKLEEYQKAEGLSEEEAQDLVYAAAEVLKNSK